MEKVTAYIYILLVCGQFAHNGIMYLFRAHLFIAELDLHLHVQAQTYGSLWFPLGEINEELVKVFYVFISKVILLEKQIKEVSLQGELYFTKQQVCWK